MEKDINPAKGNEENNKTSVFKDIGLMDKNASINVLIQAANAAQMSGALTLRDSIMVGAAIEVLTGNPV